MQNIGLMMTYNEDDVIEEVMESNSKFFDKILVIDGSTDKTPEIIQSFDCVKYFIQDKDLYPKRKIADGVRQFLLEKAQEIYGYEGWFTLLHGDEIFVDNPNDIAQRAEKINAERVNWHALNFFLHSSQRDSYNPRNRIQEEVLYYHPGGLEIRQFKNKKGIHYNLNQICNVVPTGVGKKTLLDYPIFKHYVIRSIRQKEKKRTSGLELIRNRDQSKQPSKVDLNEVFKDRLDSAYKQTRKYDGSFHELAPGNRPSFLRQYLAWHKYRKVDLGVLNKLRF